MPKKKAEETRRKIRRRPNGQLTGGIKGNSGGKKGRSGRKPDWFYEQCRDVIDRHELLSVIAGIATAEETSDRDRIQAVKFLASYAYGKAPETVRHEGEIRHTVEDPTEILLSKLDAMSRRRIVH